MLDSLRHLTSGEGFMPHGMCYLWRPDVLTLHIVADALIALAYFSIPFTLLQFVRKRRDLKFQWMFVCFAVFIIACGATHIMDIVVIWHPLYWISGGIKAITALASVPTALLLVRLLPEALRLPSPLALERANAELEREVCERKRAEVEIRRMNDALEERVAERTQQLEALNAELRAADQRKSEFIATLAHELRNPLAPIRNAVEIMRLQGALEPNLELARAILDRQSRHLTRLVDDLLDLSRVTRDKITLRRELVAVSVPIRDAVESVKSLQCGTHAINIIQPEEPIVVLGDVTRLTQIVLNLLDNACKFSARGSIIELWVGRDPKDAIIKVTDPGVGIPSESLPSIFDMFSQVSSPLDRPQGGLGIGLALVRALVQLHGGTVQAFSAGSGRGSEFTVRLPLAEP